MFYIVILILLIISFQSLIYRFSGALPNHVKIFNFVWSIILIVGLISIDNSFLISIEKNEILNIIIFFIFSMNLGFLLFTPKINSLLNHSGERIESFLLKKNIFYVIFGVLTLITLIIYRQSIPSILSGNLNAIRASIHSETVGTAGSLYSSGFEKVLMEWIVGGMILALNIVTISAYAKEKKNLPLVICSFFVTLLISVLSGGRIKLLKLTVVIISVLFIANPYPIIRYDKERVSIFVNKTLSKLLGIIILIIILGMIITMGRSVSSESSSTFLDVIVIYLFSPVLYYAKILDFNVLNMEYLYGGAFFGGILDYIGILSNNFENIPLLGQFGKIYSEETSIFLEISPGRFYNAFPTMLYHFYRDGGFLGIFVDSMLLSSGISYAYKKFKKIKSLKWESIFVLFVYLMIFGALRWEVGLPEPWAALFFILIFSSNYYQVNKDENRQKDSLLT